MAEDKFETRELNYRQWLPWTLIFRGFWVAVDPKKLLLAAGGIVVMAFGWWLLATIFYGSWNTPPVWPTDFPTSSYLSKDSSDQATDEERSLEADQRAFIAYKIKRDRWNRLYEAAGNDSHTIGAGDLADNREEFQLLQAVEENQPGARVKAKNLIINTREEAIRIQSLLPRNEPKVEEGSSSKLSYLGQPKRHGELRTWPWLEDRGNNPFLLVKGMVQGKANAWERGRFWDWLLRDQVPVLIEPLVKFFRPLAYLLHVDTGFFNGLYFLLVLAWTVGTWAIFGGAITRMAAVEIARNDKIGLGQALRFVASRWKSYVFASFAPVIGLAICAVMLMVFFGIPNWVPIFAEFWVGILFPLALGLGLCMAVILIGLPGWPMIHATLGAEGSDSFDALSRCYSYVLQKPWSYIWYAVVALVYGGIVVFFVGLMGSLTVYLTRWGISQTPLTDVFHRNPSYLFMWAPTSFDWNVLLEGRQAPPPAHWWNYIGPFCVAIWLGLVFLMIVGFGYSYFWSASTVIYLMMRRKVDDTELDEVYLEEEEPEETYSSPAAAAATPQPASSAAPSLQMVEAPSLVRTGASAPAPSPSPVSEETAANPGDGNVPAGGAASS